jgi:hypothetical protein
MKKIEKAKTHWKPVFKRMRDDMKFVKGDQWPGQVEDDDRYVANLCQRHVQQRVSSLYAKNPKCVARRRKTLDFQMWDENPQSLQQAMMMSQPQVDPMTGMVMPPDPNAMMLMQDVMQGRQRRQMIERIGKTLEILFNYYTHEQKPNFKLAMKQLVRRVETTGVGFIKVGFQRMMGRTPDVNAQIADFSDRLAEIQRLAEESMEENGEQSLADVLMQEPEIIIREGLVFDFPRAWNLIVDPACVQLKGFVGANWVAQEFTFDAEAIQRIYGIDDIGGKGAKEYRSSESSQEAFEQARKGDDQCGEYRVYEIYDKTTGEMLTVCEGYDDFLEEPTTPRVFIEDFYPFFVLSFNDIEDEKCIYPPSDVRLMRHMQMEHNRAREGLRQHRIANIPAYGAPKGVLDDEDKWKLATHETSELIEFNVPPTTDMKSVIQPLQKVPIDPSVYDTSPFFDDIQKAIGSQEANFGGVSGAAATEISVAEGSRMGTIQSNIDDMNDFLTEVSRAASQIMLREVSAETAKKIAGPGAVWPEATRTDVVEELWLEIEAGSSGRPNKAYEVANFERLAPTLLQIPGISPQWLAKQALQRLDDNLDLTDAIMEGLPSIMSMNRMSQMGTGDPATDPNQQGGEGGDKNSNPQQNESQGQPAFPTTTV